MANCPICDRSLPDDFGLIECAQCGAALFLEFDGSVRRRDDVGKSDLEQKAEAPTVQLGGMGMDSRTPEAADLPKMKLPENLPPVDLGNIGGVEPPTVPAESESEFVQAIAPPVKMAAPEEPSASGFGMKDIADFGNSDSSANREGALTYDLSISGIDSADLRMAIKAALTDPLFVWDSESLMRDAKHGELKLSKVTAVKAAIVVQRLRGLPIDIKWVQHGLFEA